jgi:copper(I)-binding protein
MPNLYRFVWLLLGLLLSTIVYAGDIQVAGAWARATLPGQDMGMVDLSITSKQAATLIGVSSTVCKSVEMHSMTHENNMMKMREVNAITLTAGKRVNLAESGYHLMLVGLKGSLKAGESVPLTLSIKMSGQRVVKIKVRAEVKPVTTTQAPDGEDAHTH